MQTKYTALGFELLDDDKVLITKMAKNVLNSDIEIIDLASYNFKKENNIYLIFGEKTSRRVGAISNSFVLPEIKKLHPSGGDNILRKQAFEVLLTVKDYKLEITEETYNNNSLPELTSQEIIELSNKLKELGHLEWICTSKGGDKFVISREKNENTSLTFTELFSIKMAMELLNLKEITIVRKNY